MLKTKSKYEIAIQLLVAAALAVFFYAGLVVAKATSQTFTLLAVTGLLLLLTKRWLPRQSNGFPKPLKIWLLIALGVWLSALISWLANGQIPEQSKALSSPYGKLLILPLVLWAISHTFRLSNNIRYGVFSLIAGGAIAAGVLGLDSRFGWLGFVPMSSRVGLGVNPIYYGDSALVMGFISGIFAISWISARRYLLGCIGFLALLLGLVSSGLSLSRGGWLAIPIFFVWFVWYLHQHKMYRTLIIGVIISAVGVGWVILDKHNPIHQRIVAAKENVASFDAKNSRTSAGYRLRMWQHALTLSTQKPLLGHGPMSYVFNDIDEQGNLIFYYHHSHNGYLQILSTLGILGLVFYLLLFVYPLMYFWRCWRQSQVQDVAIAGMVLITAYMVFVLTDVIFYRSVGLLYFLMLVSLLMMMIEHEKNQPVVS